MKTYFKDLITVQSECTKKTIGFMKDHPVGYAMTLIGAFVIPITIFMIINKIQLKKIEVNIID